jgi:hypothetical protein
MQLLNAGPTWLWALLAGALITTLLVLGSFARIALVFKGLCAATTPLTRRVSMAFRSDS